MWYSVIAICEPHFAVVRAGERLPPLARPELFWYHSSMAASTVVPAKKKRGPPATGKGHQISVRLQPSALERLDIWIVAQPEPKPSRPEAIRRLVDKALARFKG